MKYTRVICFAVFIMPFVNSNAQQMSGNFLASGLEDINMLVDDFIRPGTDAAIYGLANGWYNSAKVKDVGSFEISIIGGASQVKNNKKSFALNQNDYEFLRFSSGPEIQQVGTILGQNSPDVFMDIIDEDQKIGSIALPQGVASKNVEYLPNLILQGSVGLPFSTELKVRYLPEIEVEDVATQFYGVGLQHEFTNWIPTFKVLPIAISGFVGYNNFEGEYDLSLQTSMMPTINQPVVTEIDSWLYALVVSTKFPTINFYGSLGSVSGTAKTKFKTDRAGFNSEAGMQKTKTNGFLASLGTKLTLGFFRVNIDYSFQEFNSLNVGINFGI